MRSALLLALLRDWRHHRRDYRESWPMKLADCAAGCFRALLFAAAVFGIDAAVAAPVSVGEFAGNWNAPAGEYPGQGVSAGTGVFARAGSRALRPRLLKNSSPRRDASAPSPAPAAPPPALPIEKRWQPHQPACSAPRARPQLRPAVERWLRPAFELRTRVSATPTGLCVGSGCRSGAGSIVSARFRESSHGDVPREGARHLRCCMPSVRARVRDGWLITRCRSTRAAATPWY